LEAGESLEKQGTPPQTVPEKQLGTETSSSPASVTEYLVVVNLNMPNAVITNATVDY
jgi:hypothetical protein